MSHHRKLLRTALITTAAIALAASLGGCAALLFVDPQPQNLTFEEGFVLEKDTVVGFHFDLDDDWVPTDGDSSLRYAIFDNDKLGCELMSVVITPQAAVSHDLPDRAGSIALLKQFPTGPGGSISTVTYPTQQGTSIDIARLRIGARGSRNSVVLAREFAQIKSALYLSVTCDPATDADDVIREELTREMPALLFREN